MTSYKYIDYPNDLTRNDYVVDMQTITESVQRLLNTIPGSLLDNPDYGCDLKRFLYEPLIESTKVFLDMSVRDAFSRWEPRVVLKSLEVKMSEDNSKLYLGMELYVPEFDKSINQIFPVE